VDDTFLVLLSASRESVSFVVPGPGTWSIVVDTRVARVPHGGTVQGGATVVMAPCSVVVLQSPGEG
jgi:hypothetical protein